MCLRIDVIHASKIDTMKCLSSITYKLNELMYYIYIYICDHMSVLIKYIFLKI